jgi:hypothetical protein
MAEPALKIEARELAFVRRFELADLSKHGPWLLKRFQAIFPDMSESAIAGYLRGILYSNEHLFLYQDNAVALAQLVYTAGIKPTAMTRIRSRALPTSICISRCGADGRVLIVCSCSKIPMCRRRWSRCISAACSM